MRLENKKDSSLKIFAIVFFAAILSRLILLGCGALLIKLMGTNKNLFEYFMNASDAEHYLHIAQNGYAASGDDANKIVFYPLFPYMIRFLSVIVRNKALSGLIISYSAFGAASAYLYKLMRLDYSEEKALDALLLLFIAPYGMFFISIHTESLFLMLSIMCVYYARKGNWIASAVIGFFAALSKSQGMLLFVPAGYEAIIQCVENKKFNKKTLAVLLIPMGFLTYLCMNKLIQGDFFAFVAHQAAPPWYNTAKWVSDSLSTSYGVGIDNYSLSTIIYWPQIILFFFSVALIFAGIYKKVRTSYLAFMGVYILVTYLQGWMISGSRYVTSCFAMYVVMAAIDNKIVKYIVYFLSGMACLHLLALWLLGYAIM